MRVEIVNEGESELELRLDSLTIASLLSNYLNADERVVFASFRQEHPLSDDVLLYVKVKEGSAREVLRENVEKALSDVRELGEALAGALK